MKTGLSSALRRNSRHGSSVAGRGPRQEIKAMSKGAQPFSSRHGGGVYGSALHAGKATTPRFGGLKVTSGLQVYKAFWNDFRDLQWFAVIFSIRLCTFRPG